MLLLVALALGHGGEEHAAPAPVVAASADAPSVAASSATFDAILRVPAGAPGAATEATLLLADHATSAPVEGATATLTLSGPGAAQAELGAAGAPGHYHGAVTLPAYGEYAGALVVTTPTASDLLAVSGFAWMEAAVAEHAHEGPAPAAVVALLLVGVGIAGVGIGFVLGRSRGAAAGLALVLAAGAASRRVEAHGGEDHGAPTAARAAGAALEMPLESQFLVGLRTAPLVRELFQERVPAIGAFVARPGEAATLGAPVDGVLVAPSGGFPTPGQAVQAGDTLALLREIPSTADRAAIAQERGAAATAVAEARAALVLAERDASTVDQLGDSLSERERTERRGAADVARVRLREAEAALAALESGVTVAIRAPVGGRLGAIAARPGDQVSAGDPLFRVIDAAGLWMEARVPERLALGLVAGAQATVTPASAPEARLPAVVLDAGQEADPATGSVTVTLAVEAGGLGLLPGMGATAWLGRGPARDAVVLPAAALVDSDGARLAFVKTGPERFEARELRLGGRADGRWEVLGGVNPGERVVVAGTWSLRSLAGR